MIAIACALPRPAARARTRDRRGLALQHRIAELDHLRQRRFASLPAAQPHFPRAPRSQFWRPRPRMHSMDQILRLTLFFLSANNADEDKVSSELAGGLRRRWSTSRRVRSVARRSSRTMRIVPSRCRGSLTTGRRPSRPDAELRRAKQIVGRAGAAARPTGGLFEALLGLRLQHDSGQVGEGRSWQHRHGSTSSARRRHREPPRGRCSARSGQGMDDRHRLPQGHGRYGRRAGRPSRSCARRRGNQGSAESRRHSRDSNSPEVVSLATVEDETSSPHQRQRGCGRPARRRCPRRGGRQASAPGARRTARSAPSPPPPGTAWSNRNPRRPAAGSLWAQ